MCGKILSQPAKGEATCIKNEECIGGRTTKGVNQESTEKPWAEPRRIEKGQQTDLVKPIWRKHGETNGRRFNHVDQKKRNQKNRGTV